ncbi:uncharacterized protein LACBIDRAFT_299270 [Laccaria bicolor S238N-H82]|uniref:Predicted protein n=1 Tax=Laccaria bicolor (strain S238N-H82 / ATCC MYA-4686) TaxID=486041 RepID=B0DED8_LACBS|nr:uncharacterized protein LACBIDRAFT_299270 [Laccaria bicolor S238N-H82]EDR06914.1 predicted protein [Laccaria bicolor S238N-H82]|eukprot:XP_001882287.1 predicted protein [Laccaria bicolor S238N-H82]
MVSLGPLGWLERKCQLLNVSVFSRTPTFTHSSQTNSQCLRCVEVFAKEGRLLVRAEGTNERRLDEPSEMAGVSCGMELRSWVEVETLAAVLRLDDQRAFARYKGGVRSRRGSVWRLVELGVMGY